MPPWRVDELRYLNSHMSRECCDSQRDGKSKRVRSCLFLDMCWAVSRFCFSENVIVSDSETPRALIVHIFRTPKYKKRGHITQGNSGRLCPSFSAVQLARQYKTTSDPVGILLCAARACMTTQL
jgi:hypothetical protein